MMTMNTLKVTLALLVGLGSPGVVSATLRETACSSGLLKWLPWCKKAEPPLSITQKLFAIGREFKPELYALFDEKLPVAEKLFEAHYEDSPLIATNARLEEMAVEYNALSESVPIDAYSENFTHTPLMSNSFNFTKFMDAKVPIIEDALTEAVVSKAPETKLLEESALYTLLAGGKRVRPLLCLATFEMFSDEDSSIALPTAVSAELIHTMSLMTDDLPSIDNDDLRRGVPANHVVYGENVAMLAAGSLVAVSFLQVLEETKGVDDGRKVNVATRLAKVIGAMAGGELMDIGYQNKTDNATLRGLNWVHLHKTASLIQYSVASGAVLAGASPDEVAAIDEYGSNIGLAFQVIDDILDVEQDEAAGKLTYPKLLGIDGARAEARLLIATAKNAVARFGDRANVLNSFADFLLARGQAINSNSTGKIFFNGIFNPYNR